MSKPKLTTVLPAIAAVLARAMCVAPASAQNTDATILHVFGTKQDGDHAQDMRTMDSKGVLYGTTPFGGVNGLGVAYSLAPSKAGKKGWKESVLDNFGNGAADSASPRSDVSISNKGVLTGTASSGGSAGAGT